MIPALINPMQGSVGATAAAACDPFLSSVVLLADFEGTPTLSYIEQSPSHKTVTFSDTVDANSQSDMSSTQAEYGTQSARSNNTTGASAPNSSDFYLSDANASQFTIEYSFFQTERANNYNAVNRLSAVGQFSFSVRHTAANLDFFYSNDGTTINSTSATGAITSGNMGIWAKYAICKNASGKIRIFVNGVMVTSATPADSTMFHSNQTTGINESAASQTSYLDNIRITKGVCRYDSDSNYTVATAAFPAIVCSSAPPSFVNGGIIAESTSPSTGTLPGSRVTGNLLVLYFKSRNTANDPSVSAGWTQLDTFGFGGASQRFGVYYRFVTGSETAPVITCAGGGAIVSVVAQYSGTSASTPVVAGSKNGGTGTAITTAAITSSVNAILAVSASWDDTSTSPTQPAGFNNEGTGIFQNVFGSLRLCDIIIATSGSSSPSVSCTGGNSPWGAFLFEMRPT